MNARRQAGDVRATGRPDRPKVLLLKLTERTSGKGNAYLAGWCGQARLVGFRGDDDEHGNPTWNVYASEPEPRGDGPARGGEQGS